MPKNFPILETCQIVPFWNIISNFIDSAFISIIYSKCTTPRKSIKANSPFSPTVAFSSCRSVWKSLPSRNNSRFSIKSKDKKEVNFGTPKHLYPCRSFPQEHWMYRAFRFLENYKLESYLKEDRRSAIS